MSDPFDPYGDEEEITQPSHTLEPLDLDEQIEMLEAIEERLNAEEEENFTEITDLSNANVEIRPRVVDDIIINEDVHPYKTLERLVPLLERIVRTSGTTAQELQDARWGAIEVQAIKEVRMTLKEVIPLYDRMKQELDQEEEEWVDEILDFNVSYIAVTFGENEMSNYMEAFDKFVEEHGK